MIRPLLLAVVLAGVAAAPAAARAPIDLGPGEDPSIVVDATGTAHIAYDIEGGDGYCRLPRGARVCDVRHGLPVEGAMGRPVLLDRPDGALMIVRSTDADSPDEAFHGTSYYHVSFDRGVTWSPPVPFAYGSHDFDDVVLAPDGQSVLTLDIGISRAAVQSAPFAGGATTALDLAPFMGSPVSADIAVLPDGRVVAASSDVDNATWSVFGGGNFYDPAAWATRGRIRGAADVELTSGPRGTFLLEHRPLSEQRLAPFKASYAFREFDPKRSRWRSARTAGEDRFILGGSNVIQDARGRLHVVGDSGGCVVYSRTGTRRSQWFGKSTVLFRTNVHERAPERLRVGAAPDGRGFAVWQDQSNVWAIPLKQAKGKYKPLKRTPNRPICGR